MKKVQSSISLGDGNVKVTVTLTADATEPGSNAQRQQRYEMLTFLGSQPEMSRCQGADFESMKMYHDGKSWVCEFSANAPERKVK
jgi:hypothetical protein